MLSQVPQVRALWQVLLHQVAGRLGEEDLATMTGAHDAGSLMHIKATIAFVEQAPARRCAARCARAPLRRAARKRWKAPVESPLPPRRISSTRKGHEKGISLRVNLVTMPSGKDCPQQATTIRQHTGVVLAQLLQEARRALDISKKQSNGSGRQLGWNKLSPCPASSDNSSQAL